MEQEPNNPEVATPANIKEFTKKFINKTITQSEQEILDEWIINGNTQLFIKEYKEQTRSDIKARGSLTENPCET